MSLTRRLVAALILLAVLLSAGTVGYRILEGATWFNSLYMTVITISTVGFGEVVPGLEKDPAGRAFTMVLILVGMGLLLWVVSTLTAFFVEGELSVLLRRRRMQKTIDAIRDHVIVCGAGAIGIEVIRELAATGTPCIVLDESGEQIERAGHEVEFTHLQGDATSEESLVRAGIQRARGVVTVLHEDKDNLVVTFIARQLRPDLRIVAKASHATMRDRLLRAGANAVVFPNHIGGLRMVSEMIRPHVVSFLDTMLRPGQEGTWRFEEVEVTGSCMASGKTLEAMNLTGHCGLPILAMTEGDGREITYYPGPETVLKPNTRLVVMGRSEQVEKLRRLVQMGDTGEAGPQAGT